GCPTERPDATAEQRADIGRYEAWKIEGVRHAFLECHLADVVAVVDGRNAHLVEVEHGPDMYRHRGARRLVDRFRVTLTLFLPLRHGPALREIPIYRIVRRRLVGDCIRLYAAPDQFGENVRGIAE